MVGEFSFVFTVKGAPLSFKVSFMSSLTPTQQNHVLQFKGNKLFPTASNKGEKEHDGFQMSLIY